jgi:serine/threonine protein kinase
MSQLKPDNILLAPESTLHSSSKVHLIDFGSSSRMPTDATDTGHDATGHDANEHDPFVRDADAGGPLGTQLFASVAADEFDARSSSAMHPADDIESLAYTLTYLAGRLPWEGLPASRATQAKRELLRSSATAATLTEGVECAAAAAALRALYAEVRRCQGERCDGSAGMSDVDYEACLAALGDGILESV